VTATLTALDPATSNAIGVSLGLWNSTVLTCEIRITKDNATVNTGIAGAVSNATTLCVRAYDPAALLTEPTTVTIVVDHP
jgi:hypothetical protein